MIRTMIFLLIGYGLCLVWPTIARAETFQQIAPNGSYHATRDFGSGAYDASANKTFVTWAGAGMDIWVRGYDHGSGAWGAPNKIEDNNCAGTGSDCYHNYPVIFIAPDGKLRVIRFSHSNEGYILAAPTAGNSGGTWTRTQFLAPSQNAGYPTPVVAGNTIYVFYRHDISFIYRTLRFVKSSNNGASWSTPKTIVDTGNAQADGLNEVYPNEVGYESGGRIRLAWHLAGGATHNEKTKHVYFAYLLTGDDTLRSVSGYNFGATIVADDFANQDARKLRAATVLYSAGINQAVDSRMPTRPMANGNPMIGYNKRIGAGAGDFESYRAYWDGSNWLVSRISANPGRVMDFQYVSAGTTRALLTTHNGTIDNVVKALQTSNNGQSWTQIWSLNTASQLINGADAINYVNVANAPGSGIQAVVGTADRSEIDQAAGYAGNYGVFVIRD